MKLLFPSLVRYLKTVEYKNIDKITLASFNEHLTVFSPLDFQKSSFDS